MKRGNVPAAHVCHAAGDLGSGGVREGPGKGLHARQEDPAPHARVDHDSVAWDTIGTELEDAYGWESGAPTASAFCQQRAKLRDEVMPRVNSALLAICECQAKLCHKSPEEHAI